VSHCLLTGTVGPQTCGAPDRSREPEPLLTSMGHMESRLDRLGWIGSGVHHDDERRVDDLASPKSARDDRCTRYAPLMASEVVRIVVGDFSTGDAREKSGSEMSGSMNRGASHERSVIKVTQNSKLHAVMADRLWTVHDVSAFLGVPVGTLYQWRYLRVGPPAYRVGRHIRYDPAAVRTWLDTQDAYGR
jgi:Helix-turn-helix domain